MHSANEMFPTPWQNWGWLSTIIWCALLCPADYCKHEDTPPADQKLDICQVSVLDSLFANISFFIWVSLIVHACAVCSLRVRAWAFHECLRNRVSHDFYECLRPEAVTIQPMYADYIYLGDAWHIRFSCTRWVDSFNCVWAHLVTCYFSHRVFKKVSQKRTQTTELQSFWFVFVLNYIYILYICAFVVRSYHLYYNINPVCSEFQSYNFRLNAETITFDAEAWPFAFGVSLELRVCGHWSLVT